MAIVLSLLVIGWLAAAAIGTQVYFRGEQRKPIHERNWNSEGFEKAALYTTGQRTDYSDRIPYESEAYGSAAS